MAKRTKGECGNTDYAIRGFKRRGGEPYWGYFRCSTIEDARQYASDQDAYKVEIYSGPRGVTMEMFTNLVETKYPNRERKERLKALARDPNTSLKELARRLSAGTFTCGDIRKAANIIKELSSIDFSYGNERGLKLMEWLKEVERLSDSVDKCSKMAKR